MHPEVTSLKWFSYASVAMVSVPNSFGRSWEKQGKRDSFGRSAE